MNSCQIEQAERLAQANARVNAERAARRAAATVTVAPAVPLPPLGTALATIQRTAAAPAIRALTSRELRERIGVIPSAHASFGREAMALVLVAQANTTIAAALEILTKAPRDQSVELPGPDAQAIYARRAGARIGAAPDDSPVSVGMSDAAAIYARRATQRKA